MSDVTAMQMKNTEKACRKGGEEGNFQVIIKMQAQVHNLPDPGICRNHRRFSRIAMLAISTRSGTRGNNRQQARRSKGGEVCHTPKT